MAATQICTGRYHGVVAAYFYLRLSVRSLMTRIVDALRFGAGDGSALAGGRARDTVGVVACRSPLFRFTFQPAR